MPDERMAHSLGGIGPRDRAAPNPSGVFLKKRSAGYGSVHGVQSCATAQPPWLTRSSMLR
jgi:hypothetical protein